MTEQNDNPEETPEEKETPKETAKTFKPRPRMLQRGFGFRKCCGGK